MNNNIRLLAAFAAGAAAGAAITWYLTSDKGEDAVEEFRTMAAKLKSDLAELRSKARPGRGPSPESGKARKEDFMGV